MKSAVSRVSGNMPTAFDELNALHPLRPINDAIDLKNFVFGTATIDSYTAATGLLQMHSGTTKATLLFDNATLGGGSFHLGPDTGAGTLLTRS